MSKLWVDYTNHAGKRAWRQIASVENVRLMKYPPDIVASEGTPQELTMCVPVFMIDKKEHRTLALKSIHGFHYGPVKPERPGMFDPLVGELQSALVAANERLIGHAQKTDEQEEQLEDIRLAHEELVKRVELMETEGGFVPSQGNPLAQPYALTALSHSRQLEAGVRTLASEMKERYDREYKSVRELLNAVYERLTILEQSVVIPQEVMDRHYSYDEAFADYSSMATEERIEIAIKQLRKLTDLTPFKDSINNTLFDLRRLIFQHGSEQLAAGEKVRRHDDHEELLAMHSHVFSIRTALRNGQGDQVVYFTDLLERCIQHMLRKPFAPPPAYTADEKTIDEVMSNWKEGPEPSDLAPPPPDPSPKIDPFAEIINMARDQRLSATVRLDALKFLVGEANR